MTPYSYQLITLAAAYVLVVGAGCVLGILTVLNWKASKRLDTRRSVGTRLTTLENQQKSLEDLVRTFEGRWSKRESRERRRAKQADDDDAGPEPDFLDRDALFAEWQRNKVG